MGPAGLENRPRNRDADESRRRINPPRQKGLAVIEHLTLFALLLSPPPSSTPAPVISPIEFRASFKQALAGKLSIPAQVRRDAREYRYVFVAGFMSEGMSEYFTQNARELVAIGVPRKAIHFIYPSSGETIEGNAAAVRTRFLEFADLGEEKLVVIAHSRGACDTLAFALENPDFVAEPRRGPLPGAGPVRRDRRRRLPDRRGASH